jgi:preprotein translocase subunit SecY
LLELLRQGAISGPLLITLLGPMLTATMVYIERAERRLLVQYSKRQMGNRMFQGDASYLPLRLNCSGVIPPIFASSLLLLPITIIQFSAGAGPDWLNAIVASLGRGQPLYLLIYVVLIVLFAFFYTPIVFNPQEAADNLRQHGGFLPGIRPGTQTAGYIDYVLTRITVVGAVYLATVCVLPELLIRYAGMPFYFSGSALLIVVVGMLELLAFTKTSLRFPPST